MSDNAITKVITPDEARNILDCWVNPWGEIEDQSRWSTYHWGVFKDPETGEHWGMSYSLGSTECQDETPFEYDTEVTIYLVEYKEVKKMEWVIVTKDDC